MFQTFQDTKIMYLCFLLYLALFDKGQGIIPEHSSTNYPSQHANYRPPSGNYRPPSAQRKCPTVHQVEETLSSISFLNQQDCFNLMCAPKIPRSPINNFWSRSSSQGCWYISPGQISPRISPQREGQSSPQITRQSAPAASGQFQSIDDLKRVLGQTAQEVLDNSGNVIGLEIPEEHLPPQRGAHPVDIEKSQTGTSSKGESRPSGGLSDVCCKTKEFYYINSTLMDYFGEKQTIAQHAQRGVYQFIRHGICGSQGSCYGECVQNYVNIPLVVHPTDPGMTISYRFFKIPGYCSCRVSSTIHLLG